MKTYLLPLLLLCLLLPYPVSGTLPLYPSWTRIAACSFIADTVLYDSARIVYITEPRTDSSAKSAKIPIKTSPIKKAPGSIHNHPNALGPSAIDAIALAQQFKNSKVESMYVCTPDNRLFALTIKDPVLANKFYTDYQDSIAVVAMMEMCREYDREQKAYDGINHDKQISSLYSLSTVLNMLNSGIEVMEGIMINGQPVFNLRTGQKVYMDGKRIIKRTKCL